MNRNKPTKNFTTVISYTEKKKRLGLQLNLIFNQGIKTLWVFEVVVVVMGRGRGRGESRKMCVPLEKSWLPPLIRTQMID